MLRAHGQLAPVPLPGYSPMLAGEATLRVAWVDNANPLPENAPALSNLEIDAAGNFAVNETWPEWVTTSERLIATYTTGQPKDDFIQVVNDRRVQTTMPTTVDALVLKKKIVEGWQQDSRLANTDLQTAGMALVLFRTRDGEPAAGVKPSRFSDATAAYILSDDGRSLAPDGTTLTTASGLVLWVGKSTNLVSATFETGERRYFETLGVAAAEEGLFFEVVEELSENGQ